MNNSVKELNSILNDKVHGSSELLDQICKNFLKNLNNSIYISSSIKKLKKNLSHFPVIINFTNDIENILKKNEVYNLRNYLNDFIKNKNDNYKIIFTKAENLLSKCKTVLTISHSKTLINIFKLWNNSESNVKVIICESRPKYEGVLMAKEISKSKIKTEVITEAMSGNIIKKVDAIVLGADQILPNGNIVNKTGSRMLAVIAKYHKIPVYVFASRDKIVKKKVVKQRTPGKLEEALFVNDRIKFINEDFEEIENGLITKIFTD